MTPTHQATKSKHNGSRALQRILIRLLFLSVIPIMIAGVNIHVDPAGLFRGKFGDEDHYANLMVRGKIAVAKTIANWRRVNRDYIEQAQHIASIVLMGASTSFDVRARHFGGDFYNLSLTGANLEDYAIMTDLIAKRRARPSTIIVAIDPWLFLNKAPPGWISYHDYQFWHKFDVASVSLTKGKIRISYLPPPENRAWVQRIWEHRGQMFSIPYFQRTVRQMASDGPNKVYTVASPMDVPHGQIARLTDGSYLIARFIGRINLQAIIPHSLKGMDYAALASDQRRNLFNALLDKWEREGYRVAFFVPPLGPRADTYYRDFLESFRRYYLVFAKARGIVVIGSPFGSEYGCSANDFYSVDHPKEACINKIISKSKGLLNRLH